MRVYVDPLLLAPDTSPTPDRVPEQPTDALEPGMWMRLGAADVGIAEYVDFNFEAGWGIIGSGGRGSGEDTAQNETDDVLLHFTNLTGLTEGGKTDLSGTGETEDGNDILRRLLEADALIELAPSDETPLVVMEPEADPVDPPGTVVETPGLVVEPPGPVLVPVAFDVGFHANKGLRFLDDISDGVDGTLDAGVDFNAFFGLPSVRFEGLTITSRKNGAAQQVTALFDGGDNGGLGIGGGGAFTNKVVDGNEQLIFTLDNATNRAIEIGFARPGAWSNAGPDVRVERYFEGGSVDSTLFNLSGAGKITVADGQIYDQVVLSTANGAAFAVDRFAIEVPDDDGDALVG